MSSDLTALVGDIERDRQKRGWEQPPTLYALVATADLLKSEPQMELALAGRDGVLTAIEQEQLPDSLEKFLPTIQWPAEVLGAAVAIERWIVPDDIDDQAIASWAADQPAKQDVRIVAAVMRDGSKACALRLRSHESELVTGPDLVPGLTDLLATTFAD